MSDKLPAVLPCVSEVGNTPPTSLDHTGSRRFNNLRRPLLSGNLADELRSEGVTQRSDERMKKDC